MTHCAVLNCSVVSDSLDPWILWTYGPTRFLCPWDSPDKNTGVGSLSLLQADLSYPELNQSLLYYRWILHQLSYQGSSFDPLIGFKLMKECNGLDNKKFMLLDITHCHHIYSTLPTWHKNFIYG